MFYGITLQVSITLGAERGVATVEWEASPAGDVIADSVVALLMHAQSSVASIRLTSKPCRHPREADLLPSEQAEKKQRSSDEDADDMTSHLRFLHAVLKEQYENVEGVYERNKATFEIQTDAGLGTDTMDEDGILRCSVQIEFLDTAGTSAKVTVESKDKKLAQNIQDCLHNAVASTNAVKL